MAKKKAVVEEAVAVAPTTAVFNKDDAKKYIAEHSVEKLNQKQAGSAIDALHAFIQASLAQGDKVQFIGFGTYEPRGRSARKGRNPQTGMEIDIEATVIPYFKPGTALKDAVKGK
jgi:DNA-binding protein HU-beta